MDAQVLDIIRRRRFDPLSISEPFHFRLRPVCTRDAAAILGDPRITLYCLDKTKQLALFVETPTTIDLNQAPFYYQAQFRYATRLLAVAFADFHELADAYQSRPRRVVTIYSVGRCGSTLLSKMFAGINRCCTVSEPDVYSQLLTSDYPPEQMTRLARSATRLYFKPAEPQPSTHLVLKFRSFCIELGQTIFETAQPQTPLFLYRNAEQVVQSGLRAFRNFGSPLQAIDLGHRLWFTRPLLGWAIQRNLRQAQKLNPWLGNFSPRQLANLGAVGMLTIAWISVMERYLRWHQSGMPFVALRYDDLVAHPAQIMQQVRAHCELPVEGNHGDLQELGQDSQAESPVARDRTRRWNLSAKERQTIHDLVAQHPVIRDVDFEAPATLRP